MGWSTAIRHASLPDAPPPLAQAIAPDERHLRHGDEVILIGPDGSPRAVCVHVQPARVQAHSNRPEDDWQPRPGIWIEVRSACAPGSAAAPATGWALDMGRFDEAGSRRDLEEFLDGRDVAAGAPDGDAAPP